METANFTTELKPDFSSYFFYLSTSQPEVFSQYPITPIDKFLGEEVIKSAKLKELEADIGKHLYKQLSEEDKRFILETEGVISLAYPVDWRDFKRIFKYIEEYEK